MSAAIEPVRNAHANPLAFQVGESHAPDESCYHGQLPATQPAWNALLQAFEHGASAKRLLERLSIAAKNGDRTDFKAMLGVARLTDHALALVCAVMAARNWSAQMKFEVRGTGIPGGAHYRGQLVAPQSAFDAICHAYEHISSAGALLDYLVEAASADERLEHDEIRGITMLLDHALALLSAVNATGWMEGRSNSEETRPALEIVRTTP